MTSLKVKYLLHKNLGGCNSLGIMKEYGAIAVKKENLADAQHPLF